MRAFEIMSPKKPKPLGPQTPEQARVNALQQNIENGKRALKTEKETQRRRREQVSQMRKRPGTSF